MLPPTFVCNYAVDHVIVQVAPSEGEMSREQLVHNGGHGVWLACCQNLELNIVCTDCNRVASLGCTSCALQ
jgi:hypothetical protein